jgi:hypothetical protein
MKISAFGNTTMGVPLANVLAVPPSVSTQNRMCSSTTKRARALRTSLHRLLDGGETR